ncbi:MAG: hypothetical protein ACX933_05535 [Marinobacter adhaerens]
MKGLESEAYKQQRKMLDHSHKLARDLGSANPNTQLADIVRLEMKHSGPWELAIAVSELAFKWRETRNPHYMDLAMLLCHETSVQPSPALIEAASEAARERFNGEPQGTAGKIKKESEKWRTYTLMMNLIYHGLSLPKAASKAARWMKEHGDGVYRQASSLEKQYPKEVRKTGVEADHFANWDQWLTDDNKQAWLKAIELLPDADEWQLGARR